MTPRTTSPSGGRTGPGADVAGWVAATAIAGTVLIALGAFWLSFTALTDLAVRAGIPAGQAWVWPLIVDGVIVVATISVVALAPYGRRATWYPWTLLVLGAVVSVAGNAAHATVAAAGEVTTLLAAAIAAVPPVVLLAVTHLTVELTVRTNEDSRTAGTPDHGQAGQTEDDGSPSPSRTPDRRSLTRITPTSAASPIATVASYEGRAGVPGRRVRAVALQAQGWSNRRIAAELGVHPSTVGRWLTGR